jgi:hypothetical protein
MIINFFNLSILIGFFFCLGCINQGNDGVTYKITKGDEGFGYDIMVNDKVYIRQKQIPSVSGIKGFKTEHDAQEIAKLVVYKLRNDIVPPSVTVQELDSLKIVY